MTDDRPALASVLPLHDRTGMAVDGRCWLEAMAMPFAVGIALAVALHFRLSDLGRPGRNYDEGVYLQSLLLMHHGYHPTLDFVATQGPLHLYLAYLSYALGGYTLSAARMGVVIASLLAIIGLVWAGAALIGRVGGGAAGLALALSPTFLLLSRQALPEALALAPATLAAGAAAWAWRTDRDRWRVLAGLLLGTAILVKPIVVPAGVFVVVLGYTRRSWTSSLLGPAVAFMVGILGVAAVGANATLEQVVGWRMTGAQVTLAPAVVGHNLTLLADRLVSREAPAFSALALLGAAVLVASSRRLGLAVLGWLILQGVILAVYANLSSHLGVMLLPSLALLLGVVAERGTSAGTRVCRQLLAPDAAAGSIGAANAPISGSTSFRGGVRRAVLTAVGPARRSPLERIAVGGWSLTSVLAGSLLVGGLLWYATTVPVLVQRDRAITEGQGSPDDALGQTERAAVRAIARHTRDDDWVITDAPYLAFLAGRLVPPPLVDPSDARIDAGLVTSEGALAALHAYDVDMVVLWTGKLSRLAPFVQAVSQEQVVIEQAGTGNDDFPRLIFHDPDEE